MKLINRPKLNFNQNQLAKQNLSEIDKIIIHHTAGPKDQPAAEIHRQHLALGWAGIGYHYLIHSSGKIEKGRLNSCIGSHCQGYNTNSIGIALTGNFENYPPTAAQIESLKELIIMLYAAYNIKSVKPHSYYNATACPGRYLSEICMNQNIFK